MEAQPLARNLFLLSGAVNTGVLVAGENALLFDCCDRVTPARLRALGVQQVEKILCTQHRRPNVAGAYSFVAPEWEGSSPAALVVPAREAHLFEDVAAYWSDPANRWHIYHHQPGPQVLALPLSVSDGVGEGDTIEWRGHVIRVLETPGATDGSVSYLVESDGATYAFCGDVLCGPGQVWDLYSLQKGLGGTLDYHGFLGNRRRLAASLRKLAACGAQVLIPSHGRPIAEPQAAIALTLERLEAAWRNFAAISALHYHLPGLLADVRDDPQRMSPAETAQPPPFIRRCGSTSFVIVSETGAALLVDCGDPAVIETVRGWLHDGTIRALEGCWVTHYHDDHVDALSRLRAELDCPIVSEQHMAEILEHPTRFFLPCISPNGVTVDRVTTDGERWRWHEFALTAYHFPGQTFYHGGLLLEGHGMRIFFAGDSAAPTGLDDYCAANRNFLGPGRGYRRCLALWRALRPDFILNQHLELAFAFSGEQIATMEHTLEEREQLFGALLPWPHPDFGTDEHWVRAYPYQQEVAPGSRFWVDVQFTNHGPQPTVGQVEPVLPDGWRWERGGGAAHVEVPARSDGTVEAWEGNPDRAVRIWVQVESGAMPGRYVVPLRITWDGRYLGQFRHALVDVAA